MPPVLSIVPLFLIAAPKNDTGGDIKLGGNYGSFPGREISHDKVGTMKLEDQISFDPGRKRRFITVGRKTS